MYRMNRIDRIKILKIPILYIFLIDVNTSFCL